MKVPSLFFFCLVLTFGFYHVSEAASIMQKAEGSSTSLQNGSVAAPLTADEITDALSFIFRTISQGPIYLIGEALGLPLGMLLSPILGALDMILMPVKQLLSKSLYSLAPALDKILLQVGQLLEELLDHVADTLDPDSSSASASSASSASSSSLSSFSSNVHHRQRRSLANILSLAMANLLPMSTGAVSTSGNRLDLVSILSNIFNCGTSPSDNLPSPIDIATDPTKSINTLLCFVLNRVANVGEGLLENVIPSLVESLKTINDSGVIPPPFSTWIHTFVILYEMSNSLRSTG